MVQKRLGRGLDSLLGDSRGGSTATNTVRVDEISPNPSQPRKEIEPSKLEELMASIKTHGLLQPLVVRAEGNGYILIAGERRWRACKAIGIESVPVVIRTEREDAALEIALIENIQRENLNAMEEAFAYHELHVRYKMTHEQIAQRVGKSRPTVTNRLRLLELAPEIQSAVSRGTITSSHARTLLGLDPKARMIAFENLLTNKSSVRELENVANEAGPKKGEKKKASTNPAIKDLETMFSDSLNARVLIQDKGNRGKIIIEYLDLDDFDRIRDRLVSED